MAVYVDALVRYSVEQIKPAARRFGVDWCHMTADSESELHSFAARLGLGRAAYQGNYARPALRHYDLTPGKRGQALRLGAVEVDARAHMLARVNAEIAANQ